MYLNTPAFSASVPTGGASKQKLYKTIYPLYLPPYHYMSVAILPLWVYVDAEVAGGLYVL
jgi:hypothetical protein